MAGAEQFVLTAFLAFCRIGACFLVMPGLSSIRVPVQIRLFVAVSATFALLMHLWDSLAPYAQGRFDLITLNMVSELLIGGLIGLLARIYLMALQFIGGALAMLIGYGGGMSPAIEEAEPQAPLANIISLGALVLLFALDFHHEILKALVNSYTVLPPGTMFDPQAAMVDVTDTIGESFLVMLRLGSPFIAYALLVNLAIGFVNKLTPQIPVYFISLPFVITGGLLLLYFAIGPFLRLFADGFLSTTIGR